MFYERKCLCVRVRTSCTNSIWCALNCEEHFHFRVDSTSLAKFMRLGQPNLHLLSLIRAVIHSLLHILLSKWYYKCWQRINTNHYYHFYQTKPNQYKYVYWLVQLADRSRCICAFCTHFTHCHHLWLHCAFDLDISALLTSIYSPMKSIPFRSHGFVTHCTTKWRMNLACSCVANARKCIQFLSGHRCHTYDRPTKVTLSDVIIAHSSVSSNQFFHRRIDSWFVQSELFPSFCFNFLSFWFQVLCRLFAHSLLLLSPFHLLLTVFY